jgi:excisionase family DNA binding protein
MAEEKLTHNVVEASKILGLSRGATYQACLTGQIPHLKIGKRILIPKASLARLLENAGNGTKGNGND